MTVERPPLSWGFWLRWVLATTAGFALGFVPIASLGYAFPILFAPAYALMGLMVGILQWLVLRRRVPAASKWILATIAGFVLGGAFGFIVILVASSVDLYSSLYEPLSSFAFALVLLAPLGPVVGAAQWLVLRGKVLRSRWWVLASTLSLALFATVVGAGLATDVDNAPGGLWAIGTLGGIGVGVVSGSALVWLLTRPEAYESQG